MRFDKFTKKLLDRAKELDVLTDENQEYLETLWLEREAPEILTEKHGSVAVVSDKPITASLFFDRIYPTGVKARDCPDDIRIRVRTELVRLFAISANFKLVVASS